MPNANARFSRYLGIDYSGAETADSGLKGLRVYSATADTGPTEVCVPPGARKLWTRRSLAQWLVAELSAPTPTAVGIDHGLSFPLRYFEWHGLPTAWPAFLDDFHRHWPTDEQHVYVDFVRDGWCGDGQARGGDSLWRRVTEVRAKAKSVFHFDVPGSVAKSTHAGLPWILYLRKSLGAHLHCWPFDGWRIPTETSALFETYPALWKALYPNPNLTPDQRDAFAIAAWLKRADATGSLTQFLEPELDPELLRVAGIEGWILGVQ